MEVTAKVHDAYGVLLGGLLEERKEVRNHDYVAGVVYREVQVGAVGWSELVGHDTACGVVDQDIKSVGLRSDLRGDLGGLSPVGLVILDVDDLVAGFWSEFLLDCTEGFFGLFVAAGGDEQL